MVGGEEEEGELYGENNIEIHNTICKIDSQWESAAWLRELKQGLCNRRKGGMGRETGGRSEREGHGWTYGWSLLMNDRKPQNSVKQLSFIKKFKIHTHAKKGASFHHHEWQLHCTRHFEDGLSHLYSQATLCNYVIYVMYVRMLCNNIIILVLHTSKWRLRRLK